MKAAAGTVAATLREAATTLATSSDTARLDAEVLMAHALGVSRSELLLHHMQLEAPPGFAALIERRARHEPVAYIVGRQEFFGLDFSVSPAVLIPRGDSETLVTAALEAAPGARTVLDCGTGSGALLLAVLAHLPQAKGVGIDRSPDAIAIASRNARDLCLEDRATMLERDWTTPSWSDRLGSFDLVLANPPYVEDKADLAPSVGHHEPAGALFAGQDGLEAYRALVPQLPSLLSREGVVALEIGARQSDAVRSMAGGCGFSVEEKRDLAGRPRVLVLRR